MIKTASLFVGALFLAATAAGAPPAADHFEFQDFLPRALQKNPRIYLTVITEFTPEGRTVTPATPQKPVYYVGNHSDLTEAGDVIGGEVPPPIKKLNAAMEKALRVNGYLPADKAHPPSLFIFYRWGSFNHLKMALNTPARADQTEGMSALDQASQIGPLDEFQAMNLIERAALVGGTQFGLKVARAIKINSLTVLERSDPKVEQLLEQASQDLYFVIASAYDFEAAQAGQKKLLWRTKMSAPAQGLTMDDTLPVLAVSAAPYFGRQMEEAKPLQMRLLEGKVEIGEPKVQEYLPPPAK